MEVPPGTLAFETHSGASPVQRPPRTWAGRGTGAPCSSCGLEISEREIEYEVEMRQPGSVGTLHFHFNCYQVWVREARL
jgi:hypothetical protein